MRVFWEIADSAAHFESDVRKRFDFPESRNEKAEKVTDGQETVCKHSRTGTKTHLRHFLAQSGTFRADTTFFQVLICICLGFLTIVIKTAA